MIKTEQIEINGRIFTHTWSDEGKQLIRDGIAYDDAYDPAELGRTYIESEEVEDDESE